MGISDKSLIAFFGVKDDWLCSLELDYDQIRVLVCYWNGLWQETATENWDKEASDISALASEPIKNFLSFAAARSDYLSDKSLEALDLKGFTTTLACELTSTELNWLADHYLKLSQENDKKRLFYLAEAQKRKEF